MPGGKRDQDSTGNEEYYLNLGTETCRMYLVGYTYPAGNTSSTEEPVLIESSWPLISRRQTPYHDPTRINGPRAVMIACRHVKYPRTNSLEHCNSELRIFRRNSPRTNNPNRALKGLTHHDTDGKINTCGVVSKLYRRNFTI